MQISKIWHVGNSHVVTLTKNVLKSANMEPGDNISLSSPHPGSILIKCVNFKENKTNAVCEVPNGNN